MPKIALDPTPYHHDLSLLEFPRKVAELGYEYFQLDAITKGLTR